MRQPSQQLKDKNDELNARVSQLTDELRRKTENTQNWLADRTQALETQEAELERKRSAFAQEVETLQKQRQEHIEGQTVLNEKIGQFLNQVELESSGRRPGISSNKT
jgi:predicted nuclease with TOPRIM domain